MGLQIGNRRRDDTVIMLIFRGDRHIGKGQNFIKIGHTVIHSAGRFFLPEPGKALEKGAHPVRVLRGEDTDLVRMIPGDVQMDGDQFFLLTFLAIAGACGNEKHISPAYPVGLVVVKKRTFSLSAATDDIAGLVLGLQAIFLSADADNLENLQFCQVIYHCIHTFRSYPTPIIAQSA